MKNSHSGMFSKNNCPHKQSSKCTFQYCCSELVTFFAEQLLLCITSRKLLLCHDELGTFSRIFRNNWTNSKFQFVENYDRKCDLLKKQKGKFLFDTALKEKNE